MKVYSHIYACMRLRLTWKSLFQFPLLLYSSCRVRLLEDLSYHWLRLHWVGSETMWHLMILKRGRRGLHSKHLTQWFRLEKHSIDWIAIFVKKAPKTLANELREQVFTSTLLPLSKWPEKASKYVAECELIIHPQAIYGWVAVTKPSILTQVAFY